ncbi:MAG: phosphoribosylformylglycinamidine cyclo-ligase [Verrucomicrobiales bacterium]
MTESASYKDSGVDIEAGEAAVERIKPLVASTNRPGVMGGIGGFGGLFDIAAAGYDSPLLVSATDGVGTKALVATMAGRFDTIGIDLVAMCVDDLVCQGAEPLFFLDYVSVGSLDADQMEALVGGVAEGCRQANCALVGGEMAEHPGVMEPGEFDLVGFSVGAVDRSDVIDGSNVAVGDAIIGLASPNLRSNGFSLARKIMFDIAGRSLDDRAWEGSDQSVEEALLDPSVIYTPAVLVAARAFDVRAVAHITGGGLPGNLNRVLPEGTDAAIDTSSWGVPPIFTELQRLGNVTTSEMFGTFNMGVGMTIVVPQAEAEPLCDLMLDEGHPAAVIGEITPGARTVTLS